MSLRCSYSEGMFSNEPRTQLSADHELRASCFHEASHAVANFLFGVRMVSVGVCAIFEEDWDEFSYDEATDLCVVYGGLVEVQNPTAYINTPYSPLHFMHGVIFASGPAGERRYRFENGIPLHLLGVAEYDHDGIVRICSVLEQHQRSGAAFKRHVWHHAQALFSRPDAWAAVTQIAGELYDKAEKELRMEERGEAWSKIGSERVHNICQSAGLSWRQLAAS